MIVNDDTVSKALQYLAIDPHPIALAKKDMVDAENEREAWFAARFRLEQGSIRERECAVEASEVFAKLKSKESDAAMEFERHRARVRSAEMIIEVWRSEQANVRAAERVR